MRALTLVVLAVVLATAACDSSSGDDDPTGASTERVTVPDGWTTHTGNGFELSTPSDWQVTEQRGEFPFNVEGGQGELAPLVSVEAAPAAGLAPADRLDTLTATIGASGDDFEVVGEEPVSWPSASDGLRREVTYVGPGPSGEDLDIHEYLVVAVSDEIDVFIRAAALADQFGDVQQTLRDIIATLVVTPNTFEGRASESPS